MYSGKEISELVGYTSRVYGLLAALHTLDTDNYPAVERPAHLPEDKASSPFEKSYDWSTKACLLLAFLRHVEYTWKDHRGGRSSRASQRSYRCASD